MGRFLLTVWPYPGHVHPNVALACALQARGHEVAFYTGAAARTTVESEAFAYFPFQEVAVRISEIVGPVVEERHEPDQPQLYQRLTAHYSAAFDQGSLARARQLQAMYRDWILGTVPQQVSDLLAIVDSWQPDVIVSDPFMWGPMLVLHEKWRLPVAIFSFFAGCMLPGRDVPAYGLGLGRPRTRWTHVQSWVAECLRRGLAAGLRRAADRLRCSYGLGSIGMALMSYAGQMPLYLVASSPELDYGRTDLPASVHYVGPCLWDKPGREPRPPWLDQTNGCPLVYVTEGTAYARTPVLLRAAARGLADTPLEVIMTTGRHREPARLGLQPAANVRVEQWVAHSDLFPRASAVVVHGGSGTVLSALSAGLAMVIVPMEWDHLENARRVADVGAGLILPPKQCTPQRLRWAVEQVLTEPSFRHNARRIAAQLAHYRGPAQAAELLEQIA